MDWSILYDKSPYEGFEHERYPLELQGWGWEAPTFQTLIEKTRPSLIIEVGSWKGTSAIRMADICRSLSLDTKIICVDTWLGACEMWFSPVCDARCVRRLNGYPQVYYQFLANVVKTNNQDIIIPMPIPSRMGYQILDSLNLKAELIYIDASHEYPDVLSDIKAYRGLVAEGGIIFGDDYLECWPGVPQAINEFSQTEGIPMRTEGAFWILDF